MSYKIEGKIVMLDAEGENKVIRGGRLKSKFQPLTKTQKVKRWLRQLNEPIVWPNAVK